MTVDHELLAVRHVVLLVSAVAESKDHGLRRIHMPHLAVDGSDGLDSSGRRGRGDRPAQVHSWLEVLNREVLAIDVEAEVRRHCEVLHFPGAHPYDQVVSRNVDHFPSANVRLNRWLSGHMRRTLSVLSAQSRARRQKANGDRGSGVFFNSVGIHNLSCSPQQSKIWC